MSDRPFSPDDDATTLDFWEKLDREIESREIKATPPLYSRRTGGKTVLRHAPPLRMDAKIASAAGSAYTCREQRWGASGWEEMPDGRTVTAYEYNLLTGLPVGTVVALDYTAANDWRFEHYRDTPCETAVRVTLRRESDGEPLGNDPAEGGAYLDEITITHGATTVTFDDTDEAIGEYVSGSFPLDVPYTIHVRVVSPVCDDTVFEFSATYPADRECDTAHEYDFCDARFAVTVTDCVSGDPIDDLSAPGSGDPDILGMLIDDQRLDYVECSPAPPYQQRIRHFQGTLGDATLGFNLDGAGIYTEFWARLRERPYTCPATLWYWRATKGSGPLLACDSTGRYKDRCALDAVECGSLNDAAAPMYPIGSDWVNLGLRSGDGNCGFQCGDGPYGGGIRDDCTPSGLFPTTLTFTPANAGPDDVLGNLTGVPITFTCSGVDGTGALLYTASPQSNLAGFYACCDVFGAINLNCENVKFQTTGMSMHVAGPGGVTIDITNSNPQTCPGTKTHPATGGSTRGETGSASGSGPYPCHPVLIDMYMPFPPFGFLGYVGSLTE